MSEYNVGDKFVIEIDEVFRNDEDDIIHEEKLYRIKGFRSLVFDNNGLDKLQKYNGSTISEDTLEMVRMKALNDGRNEAWELAKKLWHNDAKTNDDIYGIEYFIDIANEYTPQEALAKLEAYEKEQNEMKVGDVVTVCGEKGIVVGYLCGLEEYEVWMDGYERPQRICKNEIKKTGKHIDIQSVLEQIKE